MSIKDALSKAGFKSAKNENERKQKVTKEMTKVEKHQEHRNFCEVCEAVHPDVERFKHKNSRIDAEWICSNCADKNEILDDFRITNQSNSSKTGRYRRYYGHTRDFTKESNTVKKDNRPEKKYKHDRNKNRNPGNQPARSAKSNDNRRRSNGKKSNSSSSRYTVDENGDKNFNC